MRKPSVRLRTWDGITRSSTQMCEGSRSQSPFRKPGLHAGLPGRGSPSADARPASHRHYHGQLQAGMLVDRHLLGARDKHPLQANVRIGPRLCGNSATTAFRGATSASLLISGSGWLYGVFLMPPKAWEELWRTPKLELQPVIVRITQG